MGYILLTGKNKISLIQIHNVAKALGLKDALRQLTLNINKNEFVIIAGPGGAGKTTLLQSPSGENACHFFIGIHK